MDDQPSQKLTTTELEELLSGYVLNALSLEEMVEVEHTLHKHPELRAQVQQLQEVMGWMAHASRVKAPAQLRSKILSIPQQSAAAKMRAKTRLPWWKIGGAIAAIVLLVLCVDNTFKQQQIATLERKLIALQDHQENYTFSLSGTQAALTASATVFVDVDKGKVFLETKNLPPLPADQAYYLWAVTRDRDKILCGKFNSDTPHQFLKYFAVDPKVYTGPVQLMRISRGSRVSPVDPSQHVLVLTSEA
jgi:anti-sigma-K factor RskA